MVLTHGFEAPGDGYPACTAAGCGKPAADPVHGRKIRTRVLLVLDHSSEYSSEAINAGLLEVLKDVGLVQVWASEVLP